MKKTERLNGIIFTLKERGKLSASQLSKIFEVSMRTIYRDMDALSQLKVPLIVDEGLHGGYTIDDNYFLPSIQLDDQEVIMLLMILKLGDEIRLPNMTTNYQLLKGKLLNVLKASTQEDVKALLNHIEFYTSRVNPKDYTDDILILILKSFMTKSQMEISYYHPQRDQYQNRVISPQNLSYDTGGWYLSGYCHLRDQRRVFRLDRIKEASVLETPNLYLDQYLTSSDDKYVETAYTLELSKDMYRIVKDNDYFLNHTILDSSQKLTITITTDMEEDIKNLILSNPLDVKILEPQWYKMKIQKIIQNLSLQYSEH